jgi:hypothetical protein
MESFLVQKFGIFLGYQIRLHFSILSMQNSGYV